ncbi:hypothetical protein C2S52_014846 [Perilla frutescens var. hirtella]|nr:hypothetical protein C2S52_014846 [Perilla frutescens var. hirtella]
MAEVNIRNERIEMLKAFDAAESGVKGLIDSGLSKIPQIFVRPSDEVAQELTYKTAEIEVGVIDLTDIYNNPERRKRVIEEVRIAAETWGFFQVVNHGIPQTVLDDLIDGVKMFNEMEAEEKRKYYSRDPTRRVQLNTNYDLFNSKTANWRDTLIISSPDEIRSDELPSPFRERTIEYSKQVTLLGRIILELLWEGLGLEGEYLKSMECANGQQMACHYYPACPQPELTLGTTKHSDIGFITILLQNQINGLQVLYQDQWVDVRPIRGALVVNIGDLLQLVSNGKFKSSKHRVVVNSIGPRISVASFFSGPSSEVKRYGPIAELTSEENPPKYREIVLGEYRLKFLKTGLDDYLGLNYYNL